MLPKVKNKPVFAAYGVQKYVCLSSYLCNVNQGQTMIGSFSCEYRCSFYV